MTTRRTFLIEAGALAGAGMAALPSDTSAAKKTPASPTSEQRDFVLVHGAFHGGWCYARVANLLRSRGHRVFTPTLTGLGERSHLVHAGIDCSTHIQDVINVIKWEQLKNVVLCGHSYGGLVIGGVADKIPEQIASLVYLDAILPEDGKSALDLLDASSRAAFINSTVENGGVMSPPPPPAAFNVNAADRPLVDALCTPHPFATLCERLKLTGAYQNISKKTFILATGWGETQIREIYARIKEKARSDRTWTTLEVPSGHDVMLDAPQRLTEILLGAM